MSRLRTMAVQITEENYDIAAACLAAGFVANVPLEKAIGAFLVINELKSIPANPKKRISHLQPPLLIVGNTWMPKKLFLREYRFIDENEFGERFAEVIKN